MVSKIRSTVVLVQVMTALMMLSQEARAQGRAALSPASPVTSEGDLSSAERLTIRFRGYPELSGDYRVNPDGIISIPVIGRLSVARLDAAKLEKLIATRVAEISNARDGVYVTVEVATYRPVFVTGLVKSPGSMQWQPGLTVLQAVSMAGGIYRGDRVADSDGQPSRTEAELTGFRKAIDDQRRTLALLARLRAEQTGSPTIEVPSRLVSLVGRRAADELIERQRVIFVSRRTALESQLAQLERGISLAKQEIEALRSQGGRIDEQLRARRDYRTKMQDLLAKGIVSAVRGLEEDIKVSDLEEKTINITVAISRVQTGMAQLQRDAVLLKTERETSINTDIERVEREIAQLDIVISSAKNTLEEAREEMDTMANDGRARPLVYQIVRRKGEESVTLEASSSSSLAVGDVLVVSQ
jgi:exopolysaccharide production protein ExoF